MNWTLIGIHPAPGDLYPPEPGWEQTGSSRECSTYIRKKSGSDMPEILMVGLVDAPAQACFQVVTDYEKFPQFMPFMHYAKVVKSEKIDDDTSKSSVFFYVTPPFVSNRYYTIRLTDEVNADGRDGVLRSSWVLDDSPDRKTPKDPDIKKHVKKGFGKPVEMQFADGYWLFEPLEDGRTRVSYYAWTHPGGSIPDSIAEKVNTVGLPKLWKAFRNRVKSVGG